VNCKRSLLKNGKSAFQKQRILKKKSRLDECKRLLGKGKKGEGRKTVGGISKWHTRDENA
jgi:hypothetical protein